MKPITINETIQFFTDSATLAIYDPQMIKHRILDSIDWWSVGFNELEEVKSGLISLISLSNDGSYKVRITSDSLTQDEQDFSRSVIGPLGVTTTSGKVFIGKGECLPGEGQMVSSKDISIKSGKMLELPPGHYDLLFYHIDAENYASKKLEQALPDLTIIISEREGNFAEVTTEPRVNRDIKTFLFPSKRNAQTLIPKLNKKIRAKVFNTERTESGLALKSDGAWPSSYSTYEILLEDMSQIEWKDRILIKTTRLDEENKIIYAELIEKFPRE